VWLCRMRIYISKRRRIYEYIKFPKNGMESEKK